MPATDEQRRAEAVRRLIIALDVPSAGDAEYLVQGLDGRAGVFKIGLELLFSGGAGLARRLAREGRSVFIDAKLYDISNTVERATARIADLGAAFLTVHAQDAKTLAAAVRGRGSAPMKLLGVTVLTHLRQDDLPVQGITAQLDDLVLHRAKLAQAAGLDGVVCSPREAARIRRETAPDFLIITPGIRPGSAVRADDQSRSATPAEALSAGADYLVVGRPITQAHDPAEAAERVVSEMAAALMPLP